MSAAADDDIEKPVPIMTGPKITAEEQAAATEAQAEVKLGDEALSTTPKSTTPMSGDVSLLSLNFSPDPSGSASAWGDTSSIPSNASSRWERLYEHGKAETRRRRQCNGRSAREQGCTFYPSTNTARRRPHGEDNCGLSRFDLLYQSGKISQARLEEARQLAREAESPSFRPRINRRRRSTGDAPSKSGDATCENGGGSRFEALYESAMEQHQRLEERRARLNDSECTFEPRLVAKSKSRAEEQTGQQRLDELYNHAKRIQEKRKERGAQQARQHSFRPRINDRPAPAGDESSASGISRVRALCPEKDELAKKKERLEEARVAREMQGCTFSPRVQTKTYRSKTPRLGSVHNRLYEEAQSRQRAGGDAMSLTSSSHPTSPGSVRSAKTAGPSTQQTFERLYEEGKAQTIRRAKEEKLAMERRASLEWETNKDECTFQPRIMPVSRVLAKRAEVLKRGAGTTSSEEADIFERLHALSSERQAARDRHFMDRLGLDYACTFKPRISKNSRLLAERRTRREGLAVDAHVAKHYTFMRKGQFSPRPDLLPNDEELRFMEHLGISSSSKAEQAAAPSDAAGSDLNGAKADMENDFANENLQLLAQIVEEDTANAREVAFRESSWLQ